MRECQKDEKSAKIRCAMKGDRLIVERPLNDCNRNRFLNSPSYKTINDLSQIGLITIVTICHLSVSLDIPQVNTLTMSRLS